MIRLSYLLAAIVGVNLLMAGILHGWGYDFLDRYIYQQKELLYKNALIYSRQTFKGTQAEQWNVLSDELGVKYDSGSIIYSRDSKDVPPKVLDYISDAIGSDGIVDPHDPYVYYPLGENHVFVLGPLMLNSWHQYIIEWVTFLASVLGCIFIIFLYYRTFTLHVQRIYQRLAKMRHEQQSELADSGKLGQIYQLIEQIDNEQQLLHNSNKMHIESQRDLLHGVAHEFRSPLARMQFAVEMLGDGERSDRELMQQKLNSGIEELDDLVKELLSYSRIKHMKNQLELASVSVEQLISESIDKVASFYPEVNFDYRDGCEIAIKVDERLIQRALANILRNAGRFSQSVCKVSVAADDKMLTIAIEDDGDGISPGKRERVFEPFTRLDPSRSRDSGGTGLGLAIVKSIVEQHQGTIEVDDSERLGGACFRLSIPR